MSSLGRLTVLALAVAVAAALPSKGMPDPEKVKAMLEAVKDECLPDDFSEPDFSECESQTDPSQKLQCIATVSGIIDDSGYSQAGAEAHVDSLSSDPEWRERQKEILSICSQMLRDSPAADGDKQGAFLTSCALQLTIADCGKEKLEEALEAIDSENGEEVAEQVAAMAGGRCFHRLEYSQESKQEWLACAAEAELDMDALGDSSIFKYYKALAKGNELPELSEGDVTELAGNLEKLESAIECYYKDSEEASGNKINKDKIIENIEKTKGRRLLKEAAKKIVETCNNENPDNYEEFMECYLESQQYACAGLRSFALTRGGRGGSKKGRR